MEKMLNHLNIKKKQRNCPKLLDKNLNSTSCCNLLVRELLSLSSKFWARTSIMPTNKMTHLLTSLSFRSLLSVARNTHNTGNSERSSKPICTIMQSGSERKVI